MGLLAFNVRWWTEFVEQNNLSAVFPYQDNITICGKDQQEHDANLEKFLAAAKRKNICNNDSKSVFSTRKLAILGYVIKEGVIHSDPERLSPLRILPVPHDSKSLNRCLGLFSYYSQWIPEIFNRIKPLISSKSFPLSPEAVTTFDNLKKNCRSLCYCYWWNYTIWSRNWRIWRSTSSHTCSRKQACRFLLSLTTGERA